MRSTLRIALAGATVATLALGAAPTAARADGDTKILLVLDASGSMNEPDPNGGTKLEAAKKALTATIDELPADAQVGLRVYGATYPGTDKKISCTDTQLAHPISPLDVPALTTQIESFTAQGDTPIAYSLEQAMGDLGTQGRRHIILVSDGEENCTPDPCPTVEKIMDNNIDLQIDTVGYGVDDKARAQLQCIAETGKGTYYDAADGEALTKSLDRMSTRAVRAFTIEGTPVTGTPTADDAPRLEAGQYVDTMPVSAEDKLSRHYTVVRTTPGSTLRVNAAARLPYRSLSDGQQASAWRYSLTAADGARCGSVQAISTDLLGMGTLLSRTVVALPLDPRAANPSAADRSCAEANEFTLQIERSAADSAPVPMELKIIEEQPVPDAGDLPDGVTEVQKGSAGLTSPASGTPEPVIGGTGFNDALTIGPGTYETEVVPGEIVFFRSPLGYGQSALYAIDGPDPDSDAITSLGGSSVPDYVKVAGNVYAPDRSQIDSQELWHTASYRFTRGTLEPAALPDINAVPQIQFRNRWDSPKLYFSSSNGFAMAGEYYFAVAMPMDSDTPAGVPVPVRFSLAVDGEATDVTGQSAAEPSPSPSPSASATADATPTQSPDSGNPGSDEPAGGLSPLTYGGIALIGLGLVGSLAYLVRRARS